MSTVISWNPSLKAARARVEEYQTEKIVSGSYLGPSVQTGFRYYPGDYDEYGFGSRYRANITVSQSLYRDFRRRAYSRKEGDVQIELARNSITQANQDIIRSAARAYLETAMSMVRMEHYRKMVRCASANLALYQKRRDEREARMLDSISAENALLEAELMLQDAEQEYTVRLDALNSWLPENSRTPGIKAEWIISSFENDKNLVDKMIQSHPLIREYDRKIDLQDVRLNLDKVSQTDVQMSVGYNRIGRERFLDSDSWALRVWTDFPLLFTRQSHAQTAKNETVIRQLRLAKEESARMLREQIARAALLCSGLQERKILLDRNRKLAGE